MSLREYVDSLDGVAKSRYFDKLKALGLAATDDPYASGDFQNAMRLWPPVEFGHIFCYFIERPGVYTPQEVLQCSKKGLEKSLRPDLWNHVFYLGWYLPSTLYADTRSLH